MKIKMLETRTGSPDGRTVHSYVRGEEYEMPDSLARVFVDEGWGKKVSTRVPKQVPRKKDSGPAPENKQQNKQR